MVASLVDWVALMFAPGIGLHTAHALLQKFGSPEEILKAKRTDLIAAGARSETISGLFDGDLKRRAEAEIKSAEKLKISLVALCEDRFPKLLKEIYDPPIVLYAMGNLDAVNSYPCVAVVGTRTPTHYGIHVAERLSADLARLGITIVSGLARGIDTVGHRGALSVKGRTAAVLGSGMDVIYPKENSKLVDKILADGVVFSEFPLGAHPAPQNFPIRNRIISGLSLGAVIVEASEYSGSLITARLSLEQNREVFAVPGNITSDKSFGPNYLIKQGAKLVQYWKDVVEELPPPVREYILDQAGVDTEKSKELPLMTDQESRLFNQLTIEEPKHIDKLVEMTKFDLPTLNEALLGLEMKGLIKQLPGKQFVRK